MAKYQPLVLSRDGHTHVPLDDADFLDGKVLDKKDLLSQDGGNIVHVGTDGGLTADLQAGPGVAVAGNKISAEPKSLISSAPGNRLSVADNDGLLTVAPVQAESLVSAVPDNQLKFIPGENRLFVSPADPPALISSDKDNLLTTGADRKLKVQVGELLSVSPGNALTRGDDGKLFARVVSGDDDNVLKPGKDYGVALTPQDLISHVDADNLLTRNASDGLMQVALSDVLNKLSTNYSPVSSDADNDLRRGTDGKAFYHFDDTQIKSLQAALESTGKDLAASQGTIETQRKELDAARAEIAALQTEFDALKKAFTDLRNKVLNSSPNINIQATQPDAQTAAPGTVTLYPAK